MNKVGSIEPINKDTVHKICSGQVVLNLAIAVKELVENSLDAGATNIDVKFKNYGIDLIEVTDNGSGVTDDNFASMTLKHHTSKLSDYSDLLGVSSFGFRGEALSSLCALGNLTITTRHQNSEYATKIEYDHKGNITKKLPCSRQVGTTVALSNLFHSLPVRQKEYHKNFKREFNKMTQLLYAYCLISLGVKFTCTNQTSSGSKTLVVATQGSSSYRDNIASIFGVKQLLTIMEIKPESVTNIKDNIFRGLSQEVEEEQESSNIEDIEIDLSEDSNDAETKNKGVSSQKSQGYKNGLNPIEFTGFISSCAHGSGRSSTDRQFYYVNSRPCEPTKVMKLVNEIYRQYNPNQYPFLFLNIHLEKSSVDVNVTPDKRKIFLTKEKILLDVLKSSLLKLFESIPRTLKVETNFSKGTANDVHPEINQPRIFNSFLQQFGNNKPKLSDVHSKNKDKLELKRKSTTMLDFISSKQIKTLGNKNIEESYSDSNEKASISKNLEINNPKHGNKEENLNYSENNSSNTLDHDLNITKELNNIKELPSHKNIHNEQNNSKPNLKDFNATKLEFTDSKNVNKLENKKNMDLKILDTLEPDLIIKTEHDITDISIKQKHTLAQKEKKHIMYLEFTDNIPDTQIRDLSDVVISKCHISKAENSKTISGDHPAKKPKIVTDKEDLGKNNRRTVYLKTSLEHVKILTSLYDKQNSKVMPERVKFKSTINPVLNEKCEEELSKEISKESFKQMNVIGQFNLGFIITKLDDDLFIIDQHATDEIYNFETLKKTTELTNQKLVIPQQLELTGVNEQILMDNLEIFKKNGFTFEIDAEALPTKRVKLLTIPMSKNWIFGKEDIEELLFMLRESPSEYCRPSRVRTMFASRACRKSVMIGTALSKTDMKKLVDHMAEIDKPWNCPHGRPTIRHLVNLSMVQTQH